MIAGVVAGAALLVPFDLLDNGPAALAVTASKGTSHRRGGGP